MVCSLLPHSKQLVRINFYFPVVDVVVVVVVFIKTRPEPTSLGGGAGSS